MTRPQRSAPADGTVMVFASFLRGDGVLERTFAALPMPSLVTDAEQRIVAVNPAFEQATGYRFEEIAGRNCRLLQGPGTDVSTVRGIGAALASGRTFRGEILNYTRTGEPFWNDLAIFPIRDGAGAVIGFASMQAGGRDRLGRRRLAAERLEAAELLLAAVPALTVPDAADVSRTLAEVVVRSGAHRAAVLVPEPDRGFRVAALAEADGSPWGPGAAELVAGLATTGDGPRWVLRTEASPKRAAVLAELGADRALIVPVLRGPGVRGVLLGFWGPEQESAASDEISAERVAQLAVLAGVALDNLDLIAQMRALAERDHLTGVSTRATVQARLETALEAGDAVSVLYLDVDRFKRTNDSLGHAGGDLLLRQIAARIAAAVDDPAVVGRPGGDEFVVVLPGADDAGARAAARRIAAAMREPFEVDGRTVYSGVSIGVASSGPSAAGAAGETAARLIREADDAMYVEKERMRARRRIDTPLDVVVIAADLHRAVELGEISTVFQPQFDGRTGRLVGFEALARWRHSRYGAVPPEVFIPLAEEGALIMDLSAAVLRDTVAFAEEAVRRFGPLQLSINVSTHELVDEGFLDRIRSVLPDRPDRAWALTAEVTEEELPDDDGEVRRALEALRALGVDIAVDDFGSGHSSLRTLQGLPITAIKIDETFLRRTGAVGSGMIAAIAQVGIGLGLEVMAEGVESQQQLDALRGLGCGRLQGFLLSPPLPAADALRLPRTIDEAIRVAHQR